MPLSPLTHRNLIRLSIFSTSLSITLLATSSSSSFLPKSLFPSAAAMSTSTKPQNWPTRPYAPRHTTFPYTTADLTPSDPSSDTNFYSQPRYVTHIDDHAISVLRNYFDAVLPRKGRIMDLCTSWISHYPEDIEALVAGQKNAETGKGEEERLQVLGIGMSDAEMRRNPVLLSGHYLAHDLNAKPEIPAFPSLPPLSSFPPSDTSSDKLNLNLASTTCTVSIDYLTSPVSILSSLLHHTIPSGSIHLVISNRCFPTKAVARWLRISEEERLQMVGDYLWFAGWRDIEIVELSDGTIREEGSDVVGSDGEALGSGGVVKGGGNMAALMRMMGLGSDRCDPLWVVRGRKPESESSSSKV